MPSSSRWASAASSGCALADGRRVVVKVHPSRASPRYLEPMQTVQRSLADAGFPAPAPIASPRPLARGIAVAETLMDAGAPADAHDPSAPARPERAAKPMPPGSARAFLLAHDEALLGDRPCGDR